MAAVCRTVKEVRAELAAHAEFIVIAARADIVLDPPTDGPAYGLPKDEIDELNAVIRQQRGAN